jgi:hypothetical protein
MTKVRNENPTQTNNEAKQKCTSKCAFKILPKVGPYIVCPIFFAHKFA